MEIRGNGMIKMVLTAVILSNLFLRPMPAQQNKSQIIEWKKIREAFEAYSKSPSACLDVLAKLFMTVGERPGHLNRESAQITS